MDSAREPFLKERETIAEIEEALEFTEENFAPRQPRFPTFSQIGIHVLIFITYTVFSAGYVNYALRGHAFSCPEAQTSITGIDVDYSPSTFPRLVDTEYAGPPTAAMDAKWAALMANMQMRVSGEELAREGRKMSVALPEGGGHVVWFGVYHSLHCINMLRRSVHPEYYARGDAKTPGSQRQDDDTNGGGSSNGDDGDGTAGPSLHEAIHVDHCVELLRQNAVCRPDLSLTTFRWGEQHRMPVLNVSQSEHQCVDWTAFTRSFEDRVVSREELWRLKNPLLDS